MVLPRRSTPRSRPPTSLIGRAAATAGGVLEPLENGIATSSIATRAYVGVGVMSERTWKSCSSSRAVNLRRYNFLK